MARSNVVPFMRRAPAPSALDLVAPRDMVLPLPSAPARARTRLALLLVISLMLHVALVLAAWRDPVPLTSIGEQVISLEIVVGATAPAGIAQTPGEQAVQAAAEPQQTEPQREPEQKSTEQAQEVPIAPEEKAPAQSVAPQTAVEPAVAAETPNAEPAREAAANIEVALVPPPEEKPAPKAQPKPMKHAPPKEHRRIDAPTREHATKQAKASASSNAANNVGVGRSDADSNYAGLVSAHLRRHQQYPADARSRGEQGVATVSFSLDGGGRVTATRLARGSGVASLDQEVQAMVRRASPFPAPPSGRAVSFTVPVRFRLN